MRTRLIALFLLAAPCLARADIPPPAGFVESCTIEKQCKANEEGLVCGANHTDTENCKKLHASDGYAYRCKTNGASVWTEVWCRPKGKSPAPPKKK